MQEISEFGDLLKDPKALRFFMSLSDEEKGILSIASGAMQAVVALSALPRSERDERDLEYWRGVLMGAAASIRLMKNKYTVDGERLH